jgi:Mn-dependent DtxR family transcriptional regulator
MNQQMIDRLDAKTPQRHFLRTLERDFHSRIADALLEEAEAFLGGSSAALQPGQMRVVLASYEARHGRSLADIDTVEVTWTVDAGPEDRLVLRRHGRRAFRQVRIQRLLSEALDQGGIASQEDLAYVLQVSIRTIKRDFAELESQGIYLPSRGNVRGIGRGQTHKARIIGRWLRGETYDQIALHTRHAVVSIRRYLQTFLRVVQLHRYGFSEGDIAHLVQIGVPLVSEYLAVLEENDAPEHRRRLEEQLQRISNGTKQPAVVKKGGQ